MGERLVSALYIYQQSIARVEYRTFFKHSATDVPAASKYKIGHWNNEKRTQQRKRNTVERPLGGHLWSEDRDSYPVAI